MKAGEAQIESHIDELLAILEEDSRHLEESLRRLDELRGLVVKRDEAGLGGLLDSIGKRSFDYSEIDSRRASVRARLAAALGWAVEQTTLSRLETAASQTRRAEIAGKRAALKLLTEKLKTEYVSTTMLLADCARFNSMLLSSVLRFGGAETITYNSSGSARRQGHTGLVNLQY